MWPADALKGWHDFYLLVGTAGATLLALLFVAVSLGTGFLTEERQGATRTFMSPVVIHFTSVFFLSAVALFPSHQAKFSAAGSPRSRRAAPTTPRSSTPLRPNLAASPAARLPN
jgi:hypothetical protein